MIKILAGVVVVVLLAGTGYWYWSKTKVPAAPADATAQQAELPQDQVQGQDVVVGTGAEATPGSVVKLEYEGRFEDGTVFDSSSAHGQPLEFQLGAPGIIPGFQIGVNGMKEGGERIILIPPSLGYGPEDVKDAEGNVVIPGNSTLIFSLRLVTVQTAEEAQAAVGTEATEAGSEETTE